MILIQVKGYCSKCGEFGQLVIGRGRVFCENCFGVCIFCKKEKVIFKFIAPGKPVCQNCYPRKSREKPKELECVGCNKKKTIYAFGYCYSCYLKEWRKKNDR